MPNAAKDKAFTAHVIELMQPIGPVQAKRMFGGAGIFLQGVMFGLIADSVLYLKVDKDTVTEFKAKGLEAFSYNRKGKAIKMSYYEAPEEVLEDAEEMKYWSTKAYQTALRATADR